MGSLFTIIEVMHGLIFAHIMWFVHHKKLYSYASIYNIYIYIYIYIYYTMWGPLVISWFITPSNYGYNYYKP